MEKKVNNLTRAFLFIGTSILVFLAPIKFGIPTNVIPKNIFQWFLFSWPISFFHIAVLILFTLWLVWNFTASEIKIKYSLLDIPAVVFFVTAAVSVCVAYDKHSAHVALAQILDYFMLYFLVLNVIQNEKDFFLIFGFFLASVIFVVFNGMYQYYFGLPYTREFIKIYFSGGSTDPDFLERLASDRVFSTFIYPNTFTGYLLLCIPILVGKVVFSFKNQNKTRLIWIMVLVCAVYASFLTFHRGANSGIKIKNTLANRIEYWKAGIDIIKDYPLLGVGLYNFGGVYPKYKLDIAEETQLAHNNFIQVWAEQGVLGFVAFCLFWLVLFKKGVRGLKNVKHKIIYILGLGIFTGLILFVLHNLIDFDWYIPGLALSVFALIGMFLNIIGQYKEKIFIIKRMWIRILIIFLILLCFLFALIKLEKMAI